MTFRRLTVLVLSSALVLAGGACGGDDDPSPTATATSTTNAGAPPATTAPPAEPQPLASLSLQLTQVAEVDQPVDLAVRRDDPALYVVEKGGRVRAVRDGAVDPTPVLDLSDAVSTGSEQGLLGLAFAPDGGHLYVNYTDTGGNTRIVEYAFAGGRADPSSARELLEIDQPYANHNGGHLAFGPDGHLFIGMGDGGSGNDPENRAQNLGVLLGKLLRIDPTPSAGRPYTIPSDNPFVGQDGARGEIWAYGLRNPWRFSFDRQTGDLWIGDVGQNAVEEVDFAAESSDGGENYGWPAMEGTRANKGSRPAGAVDPIFDYRQADGGCSVVAGYVYRGSAVPGLTGAFLYGDYCAGDVLAVRQADGAVTEESDLGLDVSNLSSFGQDNAGELYALSLDGAVYRVDAA
jgi:glucose/arabinose dehydrogenase